MITPLNFNNIKIGDILICKYNKNKYKIVGKSKNNRYSLKSSITGNVYTGCQYSDIQLNSLYSLEQEKKEIDILDYV